MPQRLELELGVRIARHEPRLYESRRIEDAAHGHASKRHQEEEAAFVEIIP